MHLSFTGTRSKLTQVQWACLAVTLTRLKEVGYNVFHHGDCIGSDEIAFRFAKELGYYTVSHPCDLAQFRAHTDSDEVNEVLPPLLRNKIIVDSGSALVSVVKKDVTPYDIYNSANGTRRGGTYYTTRYAMIHKKKVYLLDPSGNMTVVQKVGKELSNIYFGGPEGTEYT